MRWLILLVLLVGCATPDLEEAQIAEQKDIGELDVKLYGLTQVLEVPFGDSSYFKFEGYTAAITQKGSFTDFEGVLLYAGDELIGAEGVINTLVFDTGIEKLNAHLASADFLNVEKYATITFGHAQIKNGTMTGDLTLLGQKKEISFSVDVTENGLEADFLLDISSFGFGVAFIDDRVRISFAMNQ